MNIRISFILFCLFVPAFVLSQTIAEKKMGLTKPLGQDLDKEAQEILVKVNQETFEYKLELKELYDKVMDLYSQKAPHHQYQELLKEINLVRSKIKEIENKWRDVATTGASLEGYALWNQPDTTIEQLIIDFGSQDYVYLMTPEIGARKISMSSNLPIPRASWQEMLELVLQQSGIGIQQINPFLRELFVIKNNASHLSNITNDRNDLEVLPREQRIAFLLSPDPADVKRIWLFLNKFANPNTTHLQQIGRDILIVAQVGEIQDLLKLYDFIVSNKSGKEYKLVALSKIKAEEMAKILMAVFDHLQEGESLGVQTPSPQEEGGEASTMVTQTHSSDANGLKVIVLKSLSQALFLIGTREEINRAEQMIQDVESRIGGRKERIVFWYTTKYSDPVELAETLEQIYQVMVQGGSSQQGPGYQNQKGNPQQQNVTNIQLDDNNPDLLVPPPIVQDRYREGFYYDFNDVAVNPAPVTLAGVPNNRIPIPAPQGGNFIVDPKTGSIVMVVEQEILDQLIDVIKRLDVPKKMVQIDIMLFERRILDETDFGLNLLKIGSAASNTRQSSLTFNDIVTGTLTDTLNRGLTSFMFSRTSGNALPAYDVIYNFLLSQTDVHINSNPTVTTVNQTPATVAIVDEFSINTGIYNVETAPTTLKSSFTRAQYGITLEILPTIHMASESEDYDGGPNLISLKTDVSFDTVQGATNNLNEPPSVTRRKVTNEVVLGDGQTLILGGLRSKNTEDSKASIPFLGEIPGLGKLFSNTSMTDRTTEMFIFITPKIIADPCEDIERLKIEQLMRRPGDIPDFLFTLEEARRAERERLFAQSMQILCGRPFDPYFHTQKGCYPDYFYDFCDPDVYSWYFETCAGEYDGS